MNTDRFATGYHDQIRRDVFPLVPSAGGTLMDVGGGIGATASALKDMGRCDRAIVVDHLEGEVAPGIDALYIGDLNDAAFLDRISASEGSVQTMLCLDVLEHLVDPWTVLARLTGMLAEGGTVVISLPNAQNALVLRRLFLQGRFQLDPHGIMDRTHLRWFTRSDAIDLATSAGLEVEQVVNKIGGRPRRLLNLATFGLFRGLLVFQTQIRAGKPRAAR